MDSEGGFPLGFSSIHCWNRRYDKLDKHARKYKRLAIEEKESYRWIASAGESKKTLRGADVITIIGDRESDIYEEFALIRDERTHLLIRSCTNRSLYDQEISCLGIYRNSL